MPTSAGPCRVVVTGLGAVTPIGNDVECYRQALCAGVNGVGPITHFDASHHGCRFAAEVKDFDPSGHLDRKEAKRWERFCQFGVVTAKQALAQSGLKITEDNADRVGVLIGSGIGGVLLMETQALVMDKRGPDRVSPFTVPMMIPNMATGLTAIALGAQGPSNAVCTACAAGSNAIGDAFRTIQYGDADAMICGGTESPISPLSVAGFASARALSSRNDDPAHASRPFDAHRDGFVMGEGSGMLLLEELGHAQARGARILAEIIGYGSTCDAHHITAPPAGGGPAAKAMARCLADGRLEPSQVDYINAHGTSTGANDRTETAAIKMALGDDVAHSIPVSSTKSMTGHLLGGSGGIEAVATVLALTHGFVPPTINHAVPDPDCDLDYVPNEARELVVNVALSNSFGFGGHNVCLAFRRWS